MRSDAALAERFAAGDEAAFDVIYERHRAVVLAVAMGVLGTTQDAEDATQETFSALAVALRTKPPAELRPWLIRVARNASIDTTRRRRHRLLTLDGEIPEIPARPTHHGQAELAVVLDGIRELPEGQRMALLMRELGGHSYAEIAEFLETDEEAVKGLIARARVGLRTYREATELDCASARATIAAEPDGRRYDKTIRRHLRTCAACRSYRAALRDDAKALRAALPIQAGSVATGGISTGMLTAAKGTLLGYGLTQAATTCAASACAVGALGGMVFIAPVHRLGISPILPALRSAYAPKHTATVKKAAPTHVVLPPVHHTVTTTSYEASAASPVSDRDVAAGTAARPHAKAREHRHAPTVTRVKLPALQPVHRTAPAPISSTPASAGSQGHGHGQDQGQQGQGEGRGHAQGAGARTFVPANGNGNAPWVASPSQTDQSPSNQAQASPSQGSGHGNGNGNGWGQGSHNGAGHQHGGPHSAAGGGPWGGSSSNSSSQSGAPTASAPAPAATSTTATTSAFTTSTPSYSGQQGHGWGSQHGQGHGASAAGSNGNTGQQAGWSWAGTQTSAVQQSGWSWSNPHGNGAGQQGSPGGSQTHHHGGWGH